MVFNAALPHNALTNNVTNNFLIPNRRIHVAQTMVAHQPSSATMVDAVVCLATITLNVSHLSVTTEHAHIIKNAIMDFLLSTTNAQANCASLAMIAILEIA